MLLVTLIFPSEPPVDIYAIGFEEMVDLDTKNIVSTSGSNAREWSGELLSALNRTGPDHYCQVTEHET